MEKTTGSHLLRSAQTSWTRASFGSELKFGYLPRANGYALSAALLPAA